MSYSLRICYICPMRFQDIPGQEKVKKKLLQGLTSGRIPHAQLFLGPEGSAGLALAWAYARRILCNQPLEHDACGQCSSCRKTGQLIHPDLHFSYPTAGGEKFKLSSDVIEKWRQAMPQNPYMSLIDWLRIIEAENKQANITVDECRDIIRRLSLKSFEGGFKIQILWLPEFLGKEGNTLLKLVEEPPEKTLFLMVAHQQEQIIKTVLSRTQLVKVDRFTEQEICAYLMQQEPIAEEAAKTAAFLADGDLNRALKLAQDEDTAFFDSMRGWLQHCYAKKWNEIIAWTEQGNSLGRENLKHLLEYGVKLMREVLLYKAGARKINKVGGNEMEFVKNFHKITTESQLEKMIKLLNKTAYYVERNANVRIVLFNLSLQFKNILSSSKKKK